MIGVTTSVAWATTSAAILLLAWIATLWSLQQVAMTRVRRAATMLLALLATLALWVLLVQPLGLQLRDQTIILVTSGAAPVSRKGYATVDFTQSMAEFGDLAGLASAYPRAAEVHVYGDGLPLPQWLSGPKWSLDYRPGELPQGFVDMNWPLQLAVGYDLRVAGRLNVSPANNWRIALVSPVGEVVDEAAVQTDGGFRVAGPTSVAIAQLFRLRAIQPDGVVRWDEPLPVFVYPPVGVRASMVLRRASFEANALKNYLAENTRGLMVQTELAPEIYRREQLGADPPSGSLEMASLAGVDLLIVDSAQLADMNGDELQDIQVAVKQGLGLLVLADAALASEDLRAQSLFEAYTLTTTRSGEVELPSAGLKTTVAPLLLSVAPEHALLSVGTRVLVASKPHGAGQVAISMLRDSHAWNTLGRRDEYRRLWATVIRTVARPSWSSLTADAESEVPRIGEPVTVCQRSACRRDWLRGAGWNRFSEGAQRASVYAYQTNEWRAWRAQHTRQGTRRAALLSQVPQRDLNDIGTPLVNLAMVFWIFLLASGGLWLERKLRT